MLKNQNNIKEDESKLNEILFNNSKFKEKKLKISKILSCLIFITVILLVSINFYVSVFSLLFFSICISVIVLIFLSIYRIKSYNKLRNQFYEMFLKKDAILYDMLYIDFFTCYFLYTDPEKIMLRLLIYQTIYNFISGSYEIVLTIFIFFGFIFIDFLNEYYIYHTFYLKDDGKILYLAGK